MPPRRALLGVRRLTAWCLDWLVISAYAGLLIPVGLLIARSVQLSSGAGNILSFGCLVAPATVWLTLWERGPRAASPGKRLLGLRVRTGHDRPPGFGRALARNALKVTLPWEFGHTAAFTLASPAASTRTAMVGLICGVLACAIALVYAASLFVGSGRPPYDRVARTRVGRA